MSVIDDCGIKTLRLRSVTGLSVRACVRSLSGVEASCLKQVMMSIRFKRVRPYQLRGALLRKRYPIAGAQFIAPALEIDDE
jgi:hypothetical protein